MSRKTKNRSCCDAAGTIGNRCSMVSIVQVDGRGQMVLPKEIRMRAGIKAGDKLAIVSMEKGGKVCCLTLMKTEELAEMVMVRLAPVLKGIEK
jgi:antitoxin PrlF